MLQLFWSICRLRPNGVSFGTTDRQLDSTEQSPQPSQTRSLMTTNFCGSASLPRLRRRRFLGGAGLRIDKHGDAGDVAQFALDGVHVAAMRDRCAAREIAGVEEFRLVGNQRDSLHAFRAHTMRDGLHRNRPVDRLTTGHRDGVVVENFVGDVGGRGDSLANGERA